MCVEGNVIYALVAFVIIFLCNFFLAFVCMTKVWKCILTVEGCISHS